MITIEGESEDQGDSETGFVWSGLGDQVLGEESILGVRWPLESGEWPAAEWGGAERGQWQLQHRVLGQEQTLIPGQEQRESGQSGESRIVEIGSCPQ